MSEPPLCNRCLTPMRLENNRRKGRKPNMRWRCGRCRYLASAHKISGQEYANMVAEQDYVCAVCGREDSLVIDHDHSCCPEGKSCSKCRRGLLCNHCNRMLGLGWDDPIIMLNGFLYLTGWAQR